MRRKEYQVQNDDGIDIRSSEVISDLASTFECDIFLKHNQKEINVKSIMGFISLALSKGALIEIFFDGEDEEKAEKDIDVLLRERKLV